MWLSCCLLATDASCSQMIRPHSWLWKCCASKRLWASWVLQLPLFQPRGSLSSWMISSVGTQRYSLLWRLLWPMRLMVSSFSGGLSLLNVSHLVTSRYRLWLPATHKSQMSWICWFLGRKPPSHSILWSAREYRRICRFFGRRLRLSDRCEALARSHSIQT